MNVDHFGFSETLLEVRSPGNGKPGIRHESINNYMYL
jgi:hypothetical protein